jgi:hypothetical protein
VDRNGRGRAESLAIVEDRGSVRPKGIAPAQPRSLPPLPADFSPAGSGWWGRCKNWIKRKLFHDFKNAYVDVLARRQEGINDDVLRSHQELSSACATLTRAVAVLQERLEQLESATESGEPNCGPDFVAGFARIQTNSLNSGESSHENGCDSR